MHVPVYGNPSTVQICVLAQDELCQMVALINSDKPQYPGNITAMLAEFDT